MKLRHLVPSLAMVAAIPAAHAVEVVNGDVKLSIGLRLQSRVEIASASAANGDDYDIWENEIYPDNADDSPETLNFMFRRIRLSLKGTYGDNWKYGITFDADRVAAQANENPDLKVFDGHIGYRFDTDRITHTITFGYLNPCIIAGDLDSTGTMLMATPRLTDQTTNWSGYDMALCYSVDAGVVGGHLFLAEVDEGDDGAGGFQNNNYKVGLRVSTPIKEEWKVAKRKESYLSVAGFEHELGLGVGLESYDSPDGTDEDAVLFLLDYLIHYDGLTGNFDITYRDSDADSTEPGEELAEIIVALQAGYAIPLENDLVVEPAVRVGMIDGDIEADEEQSVYTGEGGGSGTYYGIGVNAYLDGHNNKVQVGIDGFSPEEGDGDAVIFRVQHQLEF